MNTAPRTGAPTGWASAGEAVRLVCRGHHLRRTALTALIVGTVLFVINHLDTVLAGAATTTTWVKIAVTYLVPFTVANIGLLLGTRHRPDPRPRADPPRAGEAAAHDGQAAQHPR